MIQTDRNEFRSSTTPEEQPPAKQQMAWLWAMSCCVIAFILSILMSIAPLKRLVGSPFPWQLPISKLLLVWGAWLPSDFHWLPNQHDSQVSTNNIEFLGLIALAFAIYGLFALLTRFQAKTASNRRVLCLVWIGAIIVGLSFVFAPAMLSHDIFVYADYGRSIVVHHSNPYFVPPAAFTWDVITRLDDWKFATAAYGPLWLYISALSALLSGDHPLRFVLAFRLLGFAAHLLNTWLVIRILRTSGRSQRTIALGALLYALNPLVLLESCLGGHNDILMVTFLLLGVLLCIRAEQRGFTKPIDYLPPIVAFTLAAMIKFTSMPLIIFFLVLLARRTLYQASSDAQKSVALYWRPAILKVLFAGLTGGVLALALYAPFWFGHSISAIMQSFLSPPSALSAENSFLRTIQGWVHQHGLPARNSWVYTPLTVLNSHQAWNTINTVTLACAIIAGAIGLWRSPKTHTLALAALAALGALLVVTPWFFAWYVTWIVGFAAASLSLPGNRLGHALAAFALTFSITAFFTYLMNGQPVIGNSGALIPNLRTFGIPLLVFLIVLIVDACFSKLLRFRVKRQFKDRSFQLPD